MEPILSEINAVMGVVGTFICLPDGKIAARVVPEKYTSERLDLAARVATQTVEALETFGQHVAEADLLFGQGRLILKNLRGGILVILCARTINIALLNLTANLAAKKVAAKLKPPRARVPEPGAVPVSAPVAAARAPLPPPAQAAPAAESELKAEAVVKAATPPLEPVDARFLEQLTRELAQVIGPAASIIIEDEIGLLGETPTTFPRTRAAELVERVSQSIRDATRQVRFQRVMLEAIRKL